MYRHFLRRKGKAPREQAHSRHDDFVINDHVAHESFLGQAEISGRGDQFGEEDTLSRPKFDMNVGEFKKALEGGEERLIGRFLGREYYARVDAWVGGAVSIAQFLLIEHQGPHLSGERQARLGIEAQTRSHASISNRDSAVSAWAAIGVGDGANHRWRPNGSTIRARKQGKIGDANFSQCLARTASPGLKLPPSLLYRGGDDGGFFRAKWLVFPTQRSLLYDHAWPAKEANKTQSKRYQALRPFTTPKIVLKMIFRSSMRFQLRMYSKSCSTR